MLARSSRFRVDSDLILFIDFVFSNVVLDKDRELSEANAEIKALRLSERQREKACEEV